MSGVFRLIKPNGHDGAALTSLQGFSRSRWGSVCSRHGDYVILMMKLTCPLVRIDRRHHRGCVGCTGRFVRRCPCWDFHAVRRRLSAWASVSRVVIDIGGVLLLGGGRIAAGRGGLWLHAPWTLLVF